MTENVRNFLEAISGDKEFIDRLNRAETVEAAIALAAEKGFTLTEEDLKAQAAPVGELTDDEMDAVAGGMACACVAFGAGEVSHNKETGVDDICLCIAGGGGYYKGWTWEDQSSGRCLCVAVGGGTSGDYK